MINLCDIYQSNDLVKLLLKHDGIIYGSHVRNYIKEENI